MTLIRNGTGDNGTFVGFIIYAKVQFPEGLSSTGEFLKPLPDGVQVTDCKDGYTVNHNIFADSVSCVLPWY